MSHCRFCDCELKHVFVDLGTMPVSNDFLSADQLSTPESKYPLKVFVCDQCWLVQVGEFKRATDIFNENYAYFSSYSSTWLKHCSDYAEMIATRLKLSEKNRVIEIASNDGYLLQYFQKKNIPVLGIEPTANTAAAAEAKGIETLVKYFTADFARELVAKNIKADLLIGNNVLAHVPSLNDFVEGMKILLSENGVITMEFPHLLQLVQQKQFDTIYHEHFSYFSLYSVSKIFRSHGLLIFDVEEIPTHGGSLRIYAKHFHESDGISDQVKTVLSKEEQTGMLQLKFYSSFQKEVDSIAKNFLQFLVTAKREGKKVTGHGAAAKANTLLNYSNVTSDLISFVSDNSPHKQNLFMPGSHIPVVAPEKQWETKPYYIIIFPWNIKEEIVKQFTEARDWGVQFVVAIPELMIL